MNKHLASVLFLAAVLLQPIVSVNQCPAYICSSVNINPKKLTGTNTICANTTESANNFYVNLQACDSAGYNCEDAYYLKSQPRVDRQATCSIVSVPEEMTLLPGNSCSDTIQCGYGGSCGLNNLCVGKLEGEACTSNEECNIGLTCSTAPDTLGTCVKVGQVNETCGEESTTVCGYGLICVNNACNKLLGLTAGQVFTSSGPNSWQACASLTTATFNSTHLVCTAAPVLNGSNQLNTPLTGECQYVIPSTDAPHSKTTPTCQYSQTGAATCPLGIGDLKTEFQYIIDNFFSKNLAKLCHINQPVYTMCDNAVNTLLPTNQLKAYLTAYASITIANEGYVPLTAQLADNSPCTKKLLTNWYWDLVTGGASFLSLGGSLVMALAMLLY